MSDLQKKEVDEALDAVASGAAEPAAMFAPSAEKKDADSAETEVPSEEAIKSDGERDTEGSTEASGSVDADADDASKKNLGQAQVEAVDGDGLSSEQNTDLGGKDAVQGDNAAGAGDAAAADSELSGPAAASDVTDEAGDSAAGVDGPKLPVDSDSDFGDSLGVASSDDSSVKPSDTEPPKDDAAAPTNEPPLAELKEVSPVAPSEDEQSKSIESSDSSEPLAEEKSEAAGEAAAEPAAPAAPTLGDVRGEVSGIDELPREAVRSLRDAGISLFRFLAELESADDGLQGEAKARFSAVRTQTVQLLSTIERVFVRKG